MIRIAYPIFLVPALALWVYLRARAIRRDRGAFSLRREALANLLFLYAMLVVRVTLFPLQIFMNGQRHFNWRPFVELHWLFFNPRIALLNIVGNVVMFMPLGALLPLWDRRYRKAWATILAGLSLTFSIELLQYLMGTRSADIDDIILNTLGTVLGFALYRILARLRPTR